MGPATQEFEVFQMQEFLDKGGVLDLDDRANVNTMIELRKLQIIAGVANPIAARWTKKLQAEVEPLLRMRFCPAFGYVIDRWVDSGPYWQQIPGTIGFQEPRPGLCDRMREQYDMWKKATPEENEKAKNNEMRHPILQAADEKSNQIKATNEAKGKEIVMAAVDSLSSKGVQQFLEVEKARHTGEKVVHHGADLTFVERADAAGKKNRAEGKRPSRQRSVNPGHRPSRYTRRKGGNT